MPLPLLLIIPAAVTGTIGAVNAVQGVRKIANAKNTVNKAQERYEAGCTKLQAAEAALNQRAAAYGQHQAEVVATTITRYVETMRACGRRVSVGEFATVGQFDAAPVDLESFEGLLDQFTGLLGGGLKAAGAAAGAHYGVLALVGWAGTASTGTAISGLGGAAASNAILAWLGGGSLAAGGGGMALGTIVLGSLTVAPAAIIAGWVINGQGEKAKTKAREFEADVNVTLARQHTYVEWLKRLELRIDELDELLSNLDDRATGALTRLEATQPDDDRFAAVSEETFMLLRGLAEIIRTPILREAAPVRDDPQSRPNSAGWRIPDIGALQCAVRAKVGPVGETVWIPAFDINQDTETLLARYRPSGGTQ